MKLNMCAPALHLVTECLGYQWIEYAVTNIVKSGRNDGTG
jgi:hypothetical protein